VRQARGAAEPCWIVSAPGIGWPLFAAMLEQAGIGAAGDDKAVPLYDAGNRSGHAVDAMQRGGLSALCDAPESQRAALRRLAAHRGVAFLDYPPAAADAKTPDVAAAG